MLQRKDFETTEAYIAALEAENSQMKDEAAQPLRLKVSDKGGMSIYGLGRFPVTLYKGQWKRLLADVKRIEEFLSAHDAELKNKE
jgi:hypothetical protein